MRFSNSEWRRNMSSMILLVVVVVGLVFGCHVVLEKSNVDHGDDPIGELDVSRSHMLVTGEGYTLDHDQKQNIKAEQKQKERIRKTESEQRERSKSWNKAAPERKSSEKEAKTSDPDNKNDKSERGNKPDDPSDDHADDPADNPSDDPADDPADEQVEDKSPVIATNLKNGETANGSIKSFYISAKDYKGRSISRQFFDVKANGEKLYSSGSSDSKGNYDFPLLDGTNTITVTVTDKEKNTVTQTYTINGDTTAAAPDGGEVTISLSARNLDLGYLAGPQSMKISEGEKLSYVVSRFLDDNGFRYEYLGSLSSGFYLQRIRKHGILAHWRIPDDIQRLLDKKGVSAMGWDTDSLGEKDIYEGSGWMYSHNGVVRNTGLSSVVAEDGDEIEVWFTTHLGEDE